MAAVARPRPSNGETLHERSKGKDVRISNIVAAKVRPRSVGQSLALQPAVRGRHWEATVRGRGGRGLQVQGQGCQMRAGDGFHGPGAEELVLPPLRPLAFFQCYFGRSNDRGDSWGTARSGMLGAGCAISNLLIFLTIHISRVYFRSILPHQNTHNRPWPTRSARPSDPAAWTS